MRSSFKALALVGFVLVGSGCQVLSVDPHLRVDGDPPARVATGQRATLVERSNDVSSRIGLTALGAGSRHAIELDRVPDVYRGSFSGPDAHGRYAYITHNTELQKVPPDTLTTLILGDEVVREYKQSWRVKPKNSDDPLSRRAFKLLPTHVMVGEMARCGDRVIASYHPADVLEKAIALSPASGQLAWFTFEFSDGLTPSGLDLVILDLESGAQRVLPLGRTHIDIFGDSMAPLAWLGDERHVVFRRDDAMRDRDGIFALHGDWNNWAPERVVSEPGAAIPILDSLDVNERYRPCVLDTLTGELRELSRGAYVWPTGAGDELLTSDGKALWITHASDGAIEARREILDGSALRVRSEKGPFDELAIVAALDRGHVLARFRAESDASVPRNWARTLHAPSSAFGLQLVDLESGACTRLVPRLTSGTVSATAGWVPDGLPEFRKSAHEPID